MNILFHYKHENQAVKRLKELLDSQLSKGNITTSNSFPEIDCQLENKSHPQLVLFYVSQREEINQLILLKRKLNGTHLILVMPERSADSLHLTYKLHPLLICFADGDYSEISGFIQRLNSGDNFYHDNRGGDGKIFNSIWDQSVIF
jgi:hypothetical protein